MSVNTNPVLGSVILARHGDRQGFYQSPTTYTPSATTITPLGEVQEYQLGQLYAQRYKSGVNAIAGLPADEPGSSALVSVADGGGEGGVIFDSAIAFFQGFYPPSSASNITLANGTTVVSPLGGYQYVAVDALMPEDEISLEGWTSCGTWSNNTNSVYASDFFAAKQEQVAPFLQLVMDAGLTGGRTVTLQNWYNVFDFMNVQYLHNATYARQVDAAGTGIMNQARDLVNWHEYYIYSSPAIDGIGNIAGRTIVPRILEALESFTVANTTARLSHIQISYKPFLSLFNMTNLAAPTSGFVYPEGQVDYAATVAYELRASMTGSGYDVRFLFKNGTYDSGLTAFPLFGSSSVDFPLDQFIANLAPAAINSTEEWCNACNNKKDRGCADITALKAAQANATAALASHNGGLSTLGAGFVGFGVTAAFFLALFALLLSVGVLSFGKKRKAATGSSSNSMEKKVSPN